MLDVSQLGYKIKSEKDLQKCQILKAVDYDYMKTLIITKNDVFSIQDNFNKLNNLHYHIIEEMRNRLLK